MSSEKKHEVNELIKQYWLSWKKGKNLKKLKAKKIIPSFTRINCSKILRLKKKWRYPRGRHTQKVLKPSIGYKRPFNHRFRRYVDGLLLRVIKCKKDLSKPLLQKEVFVISKPVGAKKRLEILTEAKSLDLPLYIP